jgi:hypothetical protein
MTDKLIDYDFIEIGTCDFDTLVEKSDELAVGICVEPIIDYLANLPYRKNVKKINKAVSFDNQEGYVDFYYIPEQTLLENKLNLGLKGCNSVNGYHPHHLKKKITHLVKVHRVEQIRIETLLRENFVRRVKHLKIDTEGGDCLILKNLYDYLATQDDIFYPEKITFETNMLTEYKTIVDTIDLYSKIGYKILSKNDFIKDGNTVLIKEIS